ncbi:MAG: uracil-DNA glycosylase [Chlorobi bacterium]|nr:uracil-DNA glycosylase [Chlorobiota bacterium]
MTRSYRSPLESVHAWFEYLRAITSGFVIAAGRHRPAGTETSSQPDSTHALDEDVKELTLKRESEYRMQAFHLQLPAIDPSIGMFTEESDFASSKTLEELYDRIHCCTKCPLGATRTKFVFGTGNAAAEIVLIGEAPGADEDLQGEPFVGRAGQLLTKILAAIELTRDDVYICNILKCRPPNNRKPLPSEVEQCSPYLYKQLSLISPPFIVALGLTAAEALLSRKLKMAELRGKWYDFYGARLLVTYHPAALLRNPELKRDTWEDVQRLRRAYDHYKSTGILPEPNM